MATTPKRTLPLVARYADIWNCQVASPEVFKERSALLDELLHTAGRQASDVKRTLMLPVICWRDQNELEHRMKLLRDRIPHFAAMSTEQIFAFFRTNLAGVLGTPDEVNDQLQAYAAVGVEELIMQWFSFDDIEGLELIAEQVLPYFTT